MIAILEELEGVLGQAADSYEELELKEIINGFLESLDKKNRMLFVCRYWQAESIKELSAEFHMKESAVKMRLNRTREKFREYLEKEGISV